MMKKALLLLSIFFGFYGLHAQSLISYYPLNGSGSDLNGISNGVISGATSTTDRLGNPISAYSFNGTNNYINLGNVAAARPTASVSVSIWFELNATGILSGRSMISCTENAGWAIHYLSNNTLEAVVRRNGSYGLVATPGTAYNNSGWHFACMTYDGRYLKLYLDGELKGTDDAGGNYPITYVANNTYIGADPTTGSGIDGNFYYKGKLDEAKIYSGALSAAEVLAEYQMNKPIPTLGLKLWLRADSGVNLSGNNVTQWNDLSGNNLNAIQGNSSKQPQWVANAMNGNPVVHFDGSDDILAASVLPLSSTNKATVIIVNKALNNGICVEQSRNVNSSAGGFYIYDNYQNNGWAAAVKGNAAGPFSNYVSTFISNTLSYAPKLIVASFDKSQGSYQNQIKSRMNGTDMVNASGYGGTHTDNFVNDTLFIGGRQTGNAYLEGDIAEILVYNRLLSTTERNQVENYINQKYNVGGALAQHAPGSGNAIQLDGVNDYISVPSPSFTAYTAEAWVKFNGSTQNKNIMVFTGGVATATWSHQIRTNSSGAFQHYSFDGSQNTVTSSTPIQSGVWYHVCITGQNNGMLRLYVNGKEKGTPISVGTLWTPGTQFQIGTATGNGMGIPNMEIDEIRVWNTALTESQIQQRMCRKITNTDALYNRLVFALNADELTGTTLYDASPNGRNGTLFNGATRVTSGAAIGDQSASQYSGSLSSATLGAGSDSVTATLNTGTADGLQIYRVAERPNTLNGVDSLPQNNAYYGVFIANGNSAQYQAVYTYPNNTGNNEPFLHLFRRDHNADITWEDAFATLDTTHNHLQDAGQRDEYIPGKVIVLTTFYRDNDGDLYGNAGDSIQAYSQPAGYVSNTGDCNDNDSLEHPNQLWYTDADGDLFGTGNGVVQCTRPVGRFAASELLAVSGDCDDNNPLVYPGASHLEFSSSPNFTNSLIDPANGDSYTDFRFEVMYYHAANTPPPVTYPRVTLDYEGNGQFNNPNDRTIIMTEDDVTDTNYVDGKKYYAVINALPVGSNWKTQIQCPSSNCNPVLQIGPFNYPDVLIQPDLEIFANDIVFDVPHPDPLTPLTISATVHNVSDFPASNVVVHLNNQNEPGTVFNDITIPFIAAHTNATVNWNITTPALPSWNPMQVTIDYTQVISESNENDNSAIRPFINGAYNLPGSIGATTTVSPAVAYSAAGTYNTLNGFAYYQGTAIPLPDSSVAGATIEFTIVETGASYTTYTNSLGHFSYTFPRPLAIGTYHIQGTCTDYTLTGNFNTSFEVIQPPVIIPCTLPNLVCGIQLTNPEIVVGSSVTGNIVVSNAGLGTSVATTLSFSQSGGSPILDTLYTIPSLAHNQTYSIPFTLTFNTIGQFTLCGTADYNNIEPECSEGNSACNVVYVFPDLPDIVAGDGPGGTTYQCQTNSVSFQVHNNGGVASGPFDCKVYTRLNGVLVSTYTHHINNILPIQYSPSNKTSFNMPFVPASTGTYTFELYCDSPNVVTELSELNNAGTYSRSIIACKPNFWIDDCENFDVTSADGLYTAGDSVTIKIRLVNNGNLAYTGAITLRDSLSGGAVYNTSYTISLNPNTSTYLYKTIVAPVPGTQNLYVTADPDNFIDELNEGDNKRSNSMCWDFAPVPFCGLNFWNYTYHPNQAVYLSVGVSNPYLYNADSLKINFKVSGPGIPGTLNLGNAVMHNVTQTCYCPFGAVLPDNFVFPQTGTYTFTMTTDPDQEFTECNETNNVLVRTVTVSNYPDLRILSQHIAPSLLNPEPGQNITMNITYENIGVSNIGDQMKLRVKVDTTVLEDVYPVNGLATGDNQTIQISTPWSSTLAGVHVIRAIIDQDHQVTEVNELNNEATRAVVVGEAANLYFQEFSSNLESPPLNALISIHSRIGNNGDLPCNAQLALYYIADNGDTLLIGVQTISVPANDSLSVDIPWTVADQHTIIVGRIQNATTVEFSYDDNTASFEIGKMQLILNSSPACNSSKGSIQCYVFGGEAPYNYLWSNGYYGSLMYAIPGVYTVTVTDSKGQSVTAAAEIIACPLILNLKCFIQGYYTGSETMTSTLVNEGRLNLPDDVDTVLVTLHAAGNGYPVLASSKALLHSNGTMSAYFPVGLVDSTCYIELSHRNAISTWSSVPLTLSAVSSYDFSMAASQAYGNNQLELESGVYGIYSGDLNYDENIDLLDLSVLEASVFGFETGYVASDLNGDGNVDLLDAPFIEGNLLNFISVMKP